MNVTKLEAALAAADITYRRTPDGACTVTLPDGGRLAVGEDEAGDWWDYTAYTADDTIVTIDGSADLTAVIDRIHHRYLNDDTHRG